MEHLRDHLKVLFYLMQPETLYESIQVTEGAGKSLPLFPLSSCWVKLESYRHFSHQIYDDYATSEEVESLHTDLKQRMERGEQGYESSQENLIGGLYQKAPEKTRWVRTNGIYQLLWEYTKGILKLENDQPVCRIEQMLEWRRCYLYLGQDILTTAHLAYEDVKRGGRTLRFVWPPQIHSDDRRVYEIVRKGLAENHYHLNGSTRVFDLTWACLMNHPKQITSNFDRDTKGPLNEQEINDRFLENLNTGIWYGSHDNKWTMKRRLLMASWLRAMLFYYLQTGTVFREECTDECSTKGQGAGRFDLLCHLDWSQLSDRAANVVEGVRYRYGRGGAVLQPNGSAAILDYAITRELMSGMTEDNPYRMLAGERSFLYQALRKIYADEFPVDRPGERRQFMDLFYLYLLLKVQFRSEMVQVNQRIGFNNFAYYQNRKDHLFEVFPEYKLEAKRLSVAAGLHREHVTSLEMRVGPKDTSVKQYQAIAYLDRCMEFVMGSERRDQRRLKRMKAGRGSEGLELESPAKRIQKACRKQYFYVLHFPKLKEQEKYEWGEEVCRNTVLRQKTRRQTVAIAKALDRSAWLSMRIRGIDTCTYEIGCRPEIFGTTFRFLRHYVPEREPFLHQKGKIVYPRLSASYHVGEDFMDLVDGLRAIDEAVLFLELERGDRLGHGLALGIEPEQYYAVKRRRSVLSKQDRLDNLVWLLYRAQALNIDMPKMLYQKLKSQAEQLMHEIYGSSSGYTLQMYYNSWKLRGDEPERYRYWRLDFEDNKERTKKYGLEGYIQRYERRQSEELDIIRKDKKICELYRLYHYDLSVKRRGNQVEVFSIEEDYIQVVRKIQEGMKREIAQKGIGIECNPSSNVLIGTFQEYQNHPIFRFHPINKELGDDKLMVSVNTDDQGVFDTSLENEYALLTCCLCNEKIGRTGDCFSAEEVYQYMEHLRAMGHAQVFPPAHPR